MFLKVSGHFRILWRTGLAWFEEEEKLFAQNRVLVDKAMAMTRTAQTAKDVYELDAALKAAMKKHSDLLGMCTGASDAGR